jgi:hypothetical protein
MENTRLYTSKCRGKLQKAFKKIKKIQQYNIVQVSTRGQRATAGCRPAAGWRPAVACWPLVDTWIVLFCHFFFEIFLSCPPLFVEVVNSY